ncbi:unnamed protein product [Psylliodes chrysocephalus]|uniref:Uncharacterized protein n=1 Tax=Psylliodes chrysocephalus TaxID=3402493 RepID=A0A9P0G8P8_9CUCU|nr:unnamed protein product [Psylliodes chrysocephala]
MMVQGIYTFFTASLYKWNLLSQFIKVSENEKLLPKRVNTTRWSSRFDTIKVLGHSYASIKRYLEQISQNREEKSVVRVEAASFAEKLDLLENGIILTFWLDILHRTNDINKALQQKNMDIRNEFDQYVAKGIALTGNEKYTERRSTKRKRHFEEPNTEVILDPRKKMRSQIYLPILDNLQTEIIH